MQTLNQQVRIAVITDEQDIASDISKKLANNFPNYPTVFTANDIETTKKYLSKHQPNLIILDTTLSNNSSAFELLEKIDETTFHIIFITDSKEIVFSEAFNNYSVINYLIKPIKTKLLTGAIKKAAYLIEIQTIIKKVKQREDKKNLSNFAIPFKSDLVTLTLTKGRKTIVTANEIARFESNGDLTEVFYIDPDKVKMTITKSLKNCEKDFAPLNFYRVHKRHLINMSHVKLIYSRSSLEVELTNGHKVPIARSKKKLFLDAYQQFKIKEETDKMTEI